MEAASTSEAMTIEAPRISEASVNFYQIHGATTHKSLLHTRRLENFKSHLIQTVVV
jgi:hypothetical protein